MINRMVEFYSARFSPRSGDEPSKIRSAWIFALLLVGMSIFSLGLDVFVDLCRSGECRNLTIHLYPFDRSLFLWGAMFYATVSFMLLNERTNYFAPLVLLLGSLGHTTLAIYGWIATHKLVFCPGCVSLWASLVLLTTVVWLVRPTAVLNQRWRIGKGFPVILLLLLLVVFMINPVLSINDVGRIPGWSEPENSISTAMTDTVQTAPEVVSPAVSQDPATQVVIPSKEPIVVASKESAKAKPIKKNTEPALPTPPANNNSKDMEEKNAPTKVSYPLSVKSSTGEEIKLDLVKKPALLFSVGCGSCTEILKVVSQLPVEKRPYLIPISLRDAEKPLLTRKLESVGLPTGLYYTFVDAPLVKSYPSLMVWNGKDAEMVEGQLHIKDILQHT